MDFLQRSTLADIAIRLGTDKEGAHHYARHYEEHFGHVRDEPIVLLEIGIGGYADPLEGGASLRMWKEFFPNGTIVGLDIYDKSALREDRIEIVQGSQTDPGVLDGLIAEYGPFDFIVDDGSHMCEHVVTTFHGLFHGLKPRGIYAIEDVQTSYWSTFGGSRTGIKEGTTMWLLLRLANGLNYEEFDIPGYQPTRSDKEVESVVFYHNLAFIKRGMNEEGSNFLPPHPRPRRVYGPTTKLKSRVVTRSGHDDLVGRAFRRALDIRSRIAPGARTG